jgi:TonB family protein
MAEILLAKTPTAGEAASLWVFGNIKLMPQFINDNNEMLMSLVRQVLDQYEKLAYGKFSESEVRFEMKVFGRRMEPFSGDSQKMMLAFNALTGDADAVWSGALHGMDSYCKMQSSGQPPNGTPRRVRVAGEIQQKKLVQQPAPEYPPLAKQARVQGVVRLSAVIGADGTVTSLSLITGHPLLVQAAMTAVRKWTYSPTLLNGNPVEVETEMDINFTLNQ